MCWPRRILLLLLILVVPIFGLFFENSSITHFFPQTYTKQNKLSDCLTAILSGKHFEFKPMVQIYTEANSASVRQEFLSTIEHFFVKSQEMASELSNFRVSISNSEQNNFWLFFIDSILSLEHLRNKVEGQREKNVFLSAKEEYYLIMIPKDTPNQMQFMKQIFEFCWTKSIINVNVLIEEASDRVITLYTYYPFTKTICENFSPTVQNRFINGMFEKNESVFLLKTSNFWQCPITVILWEEELFIGENQPSLHGIDYGYLEVLAQMVNSSLKFVVSPQGKGDVYENGSYDKAFKLLHDKAGDLMLGLWCTRDRQVVFQGIPYNFDNELIIFKIPETYNLLDSMTFPYDTYTWIIILLLLIGKWISKLLLKQSPKEHSHHRQNAERIFLGSWLFSIFILRTFYEALTFEYLHNKPSKALPNNLDEALRQNYKFIVPINGLSIYSQIQGLNDKFISGNETEYFKMFNQLDDELYALIASEKYVSAYKIKIENYFTAKKPLMKAIECVYLRRYSFLSNEIEKLMKLLYESGIYSKINRNLKSKKNIFKRDPLPEKFAWQHVRGAFEMLVILFGVCGLIFCMELFAKHNRYLNAIIEWLH